MALEDAVRKGDVSRNVADRSDPPTAKESKAPAMKTWMAEEMRAFLDHARGDGLYAAFVLLSTTRSAGGWAQAGPIEADREVLPHQ